MVVPHCGRVAHFGDTAGLIGTALGKVWIIEANDLLPPDTTVVSTMTLADTLRYRVVSPNRPHPDAVVAEPGLEGGCLALMQQRQSTFDATGYRRLPYPAQAPLRSRRCVAPRRRQPCQVGHGLLSRVLGAREQRVGFGQHEGVWPPLPSGLVTHRQPGRIDLGVHVPAPACR